MIEYEKLVMDIMNEEIVRSVLLETNPDTDDILVAKIWGMCNGNPWNAGVMYAMYKKLG